MKISRCIALAGIGLTSLLSGLALPAVEAGLIPVAVLDLDSTEPKLKERGTQVALLLSAQLSTFDGIATVERQELTKLLGEQELGASGMVDSTTAARIGHLSGARVLVMGRIFTIAGETTAAVKVMSTETGRVFGSTENFSPDAPLSGPVGKLATKIAEILKTQRGVLVAHSVSTDDRIARLKKKLAGCTLPSVTISIPEQHIGTAVIDPAAETEMGLILGQVGFVILTGDSAAKADLHINGEAFSETGIRRGNLVSCRARVEVKAVDRESGKVILIDRQVTWAVDTAEHIAAKMALQSAGAELADRLADALLAKIHSTLP